MELAAQKPLVALEFHDFDQVVVRGGSGGNQAGLFEPLAIVVVDFVAMAMALADLKFAVESGRQ